MAQLKQGLALYDISANAHLTNTVASLFKRANRRNILRGNVKKIIKVEVEKVGDNKVQVKYQHVAEPFFIELGLLTKVSPNKCTFTKADLVKDNLDMVDVFKDKYVDFDPTSTGFAPDLNFTYNSELDWGDQLNLALLDENVPMKDTECQFCYAKSGNRRKLHVVATRQVNANQNPCGYFICEKCFQQGRGSGSILQACQVLDLDYFNLVKEQNKKYLVSDEFN